MKKLVFTLLIGLLGFNFSFAQNQEENLEDDFKQDLEIMMQEIEKSFHLMEGFINQDWESKFDSIDIKKFGIDLEKFEEELEKMDLSEMNSENMMKIFELQMDMLQNIDLSQFNDLFESFGLPNPEIESTPKDGKNNKQPSPSKKKRKTYKM